MFTTCDTDELIGQIRRGDLLAISGGVVLPRETGVTLPVAAGYQVTIDLAADDTYTVRRTRAGAVLGEESTVYCDQVSDSAYRASCFHNVPFGDDDPMRRGCEGCGAEAGEECRPTCTGLDD